MSDLITFLRARLDEDEATARAASPSPWTWAMNDDRVVELHSAGPVVLSAGYQPYEECDVVVDDDDAIHIARWDPARVLAEAAAKRVVIDGYEASRDLSDDFSGWEGAAYALAQPHADHPDFDTEWRVAAS